jgi:putative membrane protein insertion efficiency factor
MGHCDTPKEFCCDGELLRPDQRTAAIIAFRRPAKQLNRETGKSANAPSATRIEHTLVSLPQWILLALLRFYIVFLSPVFGGACKFYPSCSNYAVEAVTKHGVRRGIALAAKRLLRCRPFTKGGFDPVPDREELAQTAKRAQGLPNLAATIPTSELELLNGRKL